MGLVKSHQLQAIAGNVANAHDRITGKRPAENLEVPAFEARGGERERLAALQQLGRRLLHRGDRAGFEPGGEGQGLARVARLGNQRRLALDARFAVVAAPCHHDLRFAVEEHVGAIDLGASAFEVVEEIAFVAGPADAADQMQHGGEHGEHQQQQDDEPADVGCGRFVEREQIAAALGDRGPGAGQQQERDDRRDAMGGPRGRRPMRRSADAPDRPIMSV